MTADEPQQIHKEYDMSALIEAWENPPTNDRPEHVELLGALRARPHEWARVGLKLRYASKLARENADVEARFIATGTPTQAVFLRSVAPDRPYVCPTCGEPLCPVTWHQNGATR